MATRDTYEIQTWENAPQETSPLSAARFNHIEQGIKDASDNRALRDVYDDNYISLGRREGTQRGYPSAAIGYNTIASGSSSYAAGSNTTSSGNYSSSNGLFTEAKGEAQCVFGKYNEPLTNMAVIIGGGTSTSNRKNIHTLDWQGNAIYAGDVTNGQGISLNSLKSDIDNMEIIAEGGAIAKVFDTKDELDAWLLIDGNAETLTVGQNIYIVETDTPDYWWDGTGLQVLETDAVEIESMSYEETMAVLNSSDEGAQ